MAGTELRQVRLEASESVSGWHVRVVLTTHDDEGTYGDPQVFVSTGPITTVRSSISQAWWVLYWAQQVLLDALQVEGETLELDGD